LNAHDLAQAMAQDAAGIASYLLPRGKKSAGEWKAGSTNGEEGQSLSVRLTGAKRGLWRDFAADEGGDLLDLWCATRGLSIAEAMVEAKAHLGIRDSMPARERPTFKRPTKPQCRAPESAVLQWLMGRGLTDKTIADFRIGEQARDGKTIAVFPYLRDGELVNAKYRDVSDKRGMRQEKDAEPCLYGWHLIDPRARSVAITEGEIDAMTLHQCGIPALSVNAGAGNHQWIENDWERLERFSEIHVCFDDDEAGHKGAREVIQRLGIERCKLVKFGAKDANQWLQDGAGGEDFHAALKAAKTVDPQELVSIAEFFGQVKALLYPAPTEAPLPRLMVGDRYEDIFEFRAGELTVWTGINGHGKSLMLNQVQIGLMVQGERVCVFSGEMPAVVQAKRIVRQLSGSARPTPAYIDVMGDWVRERMWIFNTTGSGAIARLLEVFHYAAKRYGITQFVIDSLMMTDVPEDGTGAFSAQKDAIQKLAGFAKANRAHVHLVVHPRKARDESNAPGKMDVGGSGKITDGADNVFSVWSARKDDEDEANDKPDALLELHKQRNGEVQHRKFWLYFNRSAQQFCIGSARRPVSFVKFEQRQAWEAA
jgi:twinkle protein